MNHETAKSLLTLYDIRANGNKWQREDGTTHVRGDHESMVWLRGIADGVGLIDKGHNKFLTDLLVSAAEIGVDRVMAELRGQL